MRINKTKFLMFILTICLFSAAIRAQPGEVAKISPNVTQISGITDAKFSPSGKFLVLQTDVGFYLIPTERLDETLAGFDVLRDKAWTEGWVKNFLPSDRIVFSSRRGLHALDPQTGKTQSIYQVSAADEEKGDYLNDGEVIVAGENLIISGGGDYDLGGKKGNIIRFDVQNGRYTRGAPIDGFRRSSISPSGKYVLYEHGGEFSNHAALYDIGRNTSRELPALFDFKRHFPKFEKTNVSTLGWVAPNRFVATIENNQSDKYQTGDFKNLDNSAAWLVLFDAAAGKIIWKRQLNGINAPVILEQLSPSKAFFDTGYSSGRFEVALADGKLRKLPEIDPPGAGFTLSLDKTRMAFFDANRVFVSSIDGADKKIVLELPESWRGESTIDGMSVRELKWTPDGKRLLVFDETRMLIVSKL